MNVLLHEHTICARLDSSNYTWFLPNFSSHVGMHSQVRKSKWPWEATGWLNNALQAQVRTIGIRIMSIASLNQITGKSREPTTWPTEDNSNSQQNTLYHTLKVFLWLSGPMRVLGNHDADLLEPKFLLFKTKQSANYRGSQIDCSGIFLKLVEIMFSASPAKSMSPSWEV